MVAYEEAWLLHGAFPENNDSHTNCLVDMLNLLTSSPSLTRVSENPDHWAGECFSKSWLRGSDELSPGRGVSDALRLKAGATVLFD